MPVRTAPIVGLALLAVVALACGAVSPTAAPTGASPTASAPSESEPSSTPRVSASAAASAPSPGPLATPAPTGSPVAWFQDAFDANLGWQPADAQLLDATVEGGAYVLRPRRSTEPAYVWAPKDGVLGPASIEATFTFPPGVGAAAGLAVADLDFGLRLVLLIAADGAWRLQRDDATAVRTLASGRTAAPTGGLPVRLRIGLEDGGVVAWANAQLLGRAAIQLDAGHVGLAVQAPSDGDRIIVDDFRVSLA